MVVSFLTAVILCVLCEGIGQWFLHILHIESDGFAAPAGSALLFCTLAVLNLPKNCLGGSFVWVKVMVMAALILSVIASLYTAQGMKKALWRGRSVYVLLSAVLLGIIITLCIDKIPYLQDEELLLMKQNCTSSALNFLQGTHLQGYGFFGSFIMWIFNGSMDKTFLTLSLFANMISVMLVLNIIDSYVIGNAWFRFALIVCSVFYNMFYAWKIAGSYTGGNWRMIFTVMLLYTIYEWLRTGRENMKYLIPVVIGAGLFCHHGFLVIAVEILYLLMTYMFSIKKIRSLNDMLIFLIPTVIYICMLLGINHHPVWAWMIVLAYTALFLAKFRHTVYHCMIQYENILMDHAKSIFMLGIPGVFLLVSIVFCIFASGKSFSYLDYISYLSLQSVRSYVFIESTLTDIILDAIRWVGILIFLFKAETLEEKGMRMILTGMVIFFVNPVFAGILQTFTGMEMYTYGFEIIFNPFTDIMIFYWIYRQFEWTVIGRWVLELSLLLCTLCGHVTSYMHMNTGLYTDLLDPDFDIREVIQP